MDSATAPTVLVVDDDDFTAQLTGLVLESSGFETAIAAGGPDALQVLADEPAIAVVVSDMNMPGMDGIQLFTALRERGFRQPFVLLTGEDAAPLRQAYPDVDGVLTKDEELEEALPSLVQSLLASR